MRVCWPGCNELGGPEAFRLVKHTQLISLKGISSYSVRFEFDCITEVGCQESHLLVCEEVSTVLEINYFEKM